MSEELYFNDELRKCLNAAGLSDCGENDAWNYRYQRVHKAHDQTVDRVTEVQRAENEKLREVIEAVLQCAGEIKRDKGCDACPMYNGPWRYDGTWCLLRPALRELGIIGNG